MIADVFLLQRVVLVAAGVPAYNPQPDGLLVHLGSGLVSPALLCFHDRHCRDLLDCGSNSATRADDYILECRCWHRVHPSRDLHGGCSSVFWNVPVR